VSERDFSTDRQLGERPPTDGALRLPAYKEVRAYMVNYIDSALSAAIKLCNPYVIPVLFVEDGPVR
jgi:hypothetical protein